MRFLILFLISANLSATCLPKDDGISCMNKPCVNYITAISKGTIVVGTCTRVYIKVKNQWVYDYTSIATTGQIGRDVFTFENRIYDIVKE